MSWVALENAINIAPIAVHSREVFGSVKEIKINERIIINWDNSSQLRLCPNFHSIGNFKLSTIGVQINLNEYAKPTQLNKVIVALFTTALNSQTDSVEKIRRIGGPAAKPSNNILNDAGFKSGLKYENLISK